MITVTFGGVQDSRDFSGELTEDRDQLYVAADIAATFGPEVVAITYPSGSTVWFVLGGRSPADDGRVIFDLEPYKQRAAFSGGAW